MKFDRQEGDNYYFLAGFFNEGMTLPSFGSNPFPSQWNLLNILSELPPILFEGNFIGAYELPTTLRIRACKGAPWLSDLSILEDILIEAWSELLGFFFLRWFEVLYTPAGIPVTAPFPPPYQEKLPGAKSGGGGASGPWWNIPHLAEDWPADSSQFTQYQVAHSVAGAGATLCPDWAFIFNDISYWHMLTLIDSGPIPEEPLIDVRWREPHLPSTMPRQWGAYDTSQPQYDFGGWKSIYSGAPQNGLIRVDGAMDSTEDFQIFYSDHVIIPYLHSTKYGKQTSVRVPAALPGKEVFLFFDPPPQPISFLPLAITALSLAAKFFPVPSPSFLPGLKICLNTKQQYGFAGTTPFAGTTKPLATTNHQFE